MELAGGEKEEHRSCCSLRRASKEGARRLLVLVLVLGTTVLVGPRERRWSWLGVDAERLVGLGAGIPSSLVIR